MSVSGTRKATAAILPGSDKAFPNHARAKPHVEQSPSDITVKSIAARAPGQLRFGGVSGVGALAQMARLFPVGDYPPTHQELVILRILKSRPHHGWTLDELLDELSKGRAKPMSYSALAVHMTHLRRKGYAVKRQVVYSVGSLEAPGSSDGIGSVHKVRQHHVDCPGGGARADRFRRR